MVELVVALGKALQITVVAEAVERPSELRALEKLGCDWAQGFLISEPVTAERAAAMFGGADLGMIEGDLQAAFPGDSSLYDSALPEVTQDNPVIEI